MPEKSAKNLKIKSAKFLKLKSADFSNFYKIFMVGDKFTPQVEFPGFEGNRLTRKSLPSFPEIP